MGFETPRKDGTAMRTSIVIAALVGLALAPAGSSASGAGPLGLTATAPAADALTTPVQYVPGTVGGRGFGGPGYVYRGGAWRGGPWVRPRWYRWAPGGAILAGAAIGFVA